MKHWLTAAAALVLASGVAAQPPEAGLAAQPPEAGVAAQPPGAGAPPAGRPGEPGSVNEARDQAAGRPSQAQPAAPKQKPRWNGVWSHSFMSPGDKEFYNLGPVLPDLSMMQPWAQAEWMRHYHGMKNGKQLLITSLRCLPAGTPNVMMEAHALQVILTPAEITFLAESDHQVRIVPIGAKLKHPANLTPSWYGDSIGHWEGDTLVIDTVGLNDRTELDPMGSPHSGALHVVERMRLLPDGRLESLVTLDDPIALSRPWVYSYRYQKGGREAEAENVGEYACAENNRDGVITLER